MRSHSVSAEGGTAAVLFEDEGDNRDSHIYDTIKGSDFLADQDVAELLVESIPFEIYQLDHWGMPWSRRDDGRIDQRRFGGYSFPRATYAQDKVGFYEMQTLYDTCLKYENIDFLNEWFCTSVISSGNGFCGLTAIEIKSGEFFVIRGRAGIICTGGAGRIYSFSTYAYSSTPDGLNMAYRKGLALKDMEFVQFHPSGILPSGILITEGARGEGGYLINNQNERFMKRYAPEKLELAPRDVVSRSMIRDFIIEAALGDSIRCVGIGAGSGLEADVLHVTDQLKGSRAIVQVPVDPPEQLIDRRLPEGIVQHEIAVLQLEEWPSLARLQDGRIVAHIVASGDGEQDEIRIVFPDPMPQHQQFLRGAESRNAEIQYLDLLIPQGSAALELALEMRPERHLQRHLLRLGLGIPQDGNPEGPGWLDLVVFAVAQTFAVDPNMRLTLVPVPEFRARAQAGSGVVVRDVVIRIRESDQPECKLADCERDTEAEEKQLADGLHR